MVEYNDFKNCFGETQKKRCETGGSLEKKLRLVVTSMSGYFSVIEETRARGWDSYYNIGLY